MRYLMIAFVLAVLAQSAGARADAPWISGVKRIVVRVTVPKRGEIREQHGAGFFVGFDDRALYLVTAGHVIWPGIVPGTNPPSNLPHNEMVNLDVELLGCANLPAVANSAQASKRDALDVALVKISLIDLPDHVRAACNGVLEHLKELPRQILDPDADLLKQHTPAWLIGPGERSQSVDSRHLTFDRYSEGKNALVFSEGFTDGDSGSPLFSDSGHLIGMAITTEGTATRFSLILAKLTRDWAPVPTNLAGSFTRLLFSDQYKGAPLSIAGAPDAPLMIPQAAPLGDVLLKLRINDTQEVTSIVNLREATDMSCEVTTSRWLARHKRTGLYATLGFAAAAGVTFALARMSRNSFDQSPSRTSYDNVELLNSITIGTGAAALGSLGATVVGYFLSDTTAITCQEGRR